MNRLDTTMWETERVFDDDTCVELDDIPGTHNWWCHTAPQARALAQQHAASLGPGWTVDHDARPRRHYHVVQVVRDPVTGQERWRRLRDGGHYFYGGSRPYGRRPGRELEVPELAAPELAASGRWARAGDVVVVYGADGGQALAREPHAAPAAELERELELTGLSQQATEAIERMENIKKDPVGDINSRDYHNHYSAARREAAGEVVARRRDGRPFSHIGDLQRACDGLFNIRNVLAGERRNPPATMTPRGREVLLARQREVERLINRLAGFLNEIGHGRFPPYHEWPPGT
jgi:putative RNase toxin 28 of polymorphic toxin system